MVVEKFLDLDQISTPILVSLWLYSHVLLVKLYYNLWKPWGALIAKCGSAVGFSESLEKELTCT